GGDATWGRVDADGVVGPRTGAEIAKAIEQVIAKYDATKPEASIPALLEIKKKLAEVRQGNGAQRIVAEKMVHLDQIIADCLGLTVETTVASAEVVAGEMLNLHSTVKVTSNVPVEWLRSMSVVSPDKFNSV